MKSACVAARLLKQYPVTEENAGPVQLLMRGGGGISAFLHSTLNILIFLLEKIIGS